MNQRRVVFVPTPEDAPPQEAGVDVFVVDTAWTPGRGDRDDVQSIRPIVGSVLERVNLFHDALEGLDAWAGAAAIAERMTVDDVSWWFRVRPFLVDYLHERLLWAHVLGQCLRSGGVVGLVVPEGEAPLVDVARSWAMRGVQTTIAPEPTTVTAEAPPTARPFTPASAPGFAPSFAPLVAGRRWWSGWRDSRHRRELGRRTLLLEARLARLRAAEPSVLVIAQPRIYQAVRVQTGDRLADPQLAAVIDRLAAGGLQPIVIGLQLDHRVDGDWQILCDDERLLPESLVKTRWATRDQHAEASSAVAARLEAAPEVPLEVEGVDLAPSLLRGLTRYGGSWLASQLQRAAIAERMMGDLRPAAVFLNHEGIRTPWLAAAKRQNVPIFAIQHGIICIDHPVYSHPRGAGLLLPDRTFTYGSFERSLLLEYGGYRTDEVDVAGSPRLDLDLGALADGPAQERERTRVREELGVTASELMLVVSTAHTPLFRRFYLAHMLDRLMRGPLPGVHVVFKQHPGETDEGPYRTLIEGMARADGYEPPPMTVVRDIDLYRLLRAADAHLGLTSTVLTDAVAAGTCNLISTAQMYGDLLGYVAAGVARPVRDIVELREALANPRPMDSATRRHFLEVHFRPGDASGRIANEIARAVKQRHGVAT